MQEMDSFSLQEAYLGVYESRDEFQEWVEELLDEGYDLSDYTWDELSEIYMEEFEQLDESGWHRRNPDKVGSSSDPDSGSGTRPRPYNPPSLPPPTAAERRGHRRSLYDYYGPSGREEALKRAKEERDKNRSRRRSSQNEEYDLYDYVMDYLISEGYADTPENAVAIMGNMSEEWKLDIIEVARVDQGLTKQQKQEARRRRGGWAGVATPPNSKGILGLYPHTGEIDRKISHHNRRLDAIEAKEKRRGTFQGPRQRSSLG